MKKLLMALILLYPLSAMAATYEWTDAQGTVHFADDLGQVPKKYRKKAKIVGEDQTGAPEVTVTSEPAKGQPKGEEQDKGPKLYAGKDEASWRTAFRTARYDVQRNEKDLATLKGRLEDTSNMSRSEYLAIQATIKNTEGNLTAAKKRLDSLQESADKAGVPPEARK